MPFSTLDFLKINNPSLLRSLNPIKSRERNTQRRVTKRYILLEEIKFNLLKPQHTNLGMTSKAMDILALLEDAIGFNILVDPNIIIEGILMMVI